MGFLQNLLNPQASASNTVTIEEMLRQMRGSPSHSGVTITPETALYVAAAFACNKVISEDVAKIPLILYRRTKKNGRKGKERATDHPYYTLLHSRPRKFLTSYNFRQMVTSHAVFRGNGLAFKNIVRGKVVELIPLNSASVEIKQTDSLDTEYEVTMKGGEKRIFTHREIFHIFDMTLNGYSGVSPVTYSREALGLSLATEKHGSLMFKNRATMGGFMMTPKVWKDPEAKRAYGKEIDEAFSGDNAHKTMVLEDGMKWQPAQMTSEDAQYLETRQFQVPEIARFFRMPLHKIQEMTRATFSNIEQQAIEYVTDCLMPWLVVWEQSLNTQLLTEAEQEEYFFEFLTDGLLRGDIKSRYEAYGLAIRDGHLNRNEVRELENRNPEEGLDEFLVPLNMSENGKEIPAKGGGEDGA